MGEVSRIQYEHDQALIDLEKKRQSLKQRLSSIGKIDLLVNVLTYKIFETQHDYRKELEQLLQQREYIVGRTDLGQGEISMGVAELDRRIADVKNTNEAQMLSLEGQRSELQREAAMKTQHMDSTLESINAQHQSILQDLEQKKAAPSLSDLEEIDRRISELHRLHTKDIENLKRLQNEGWTDYSSEERLSALLEDRGLRATQSGNFLTSSGRHLTRSEASCFGLFEGLDVGSWNTLLHRDLQKVASKSSLTEVSSTGSEMSRMGSEDVHYLKTVLGKPLTLALAEITAKQPRDPIHYLGHWLMKYRYNQELSVKQQQEMQELIGERDRLEREKVHAMLEDEARNAVLKMVVRAEEEALRRELERIAREATMDEAEDEELLDEARDVLGVYDGPTTGQRVNTT